MSASNDRAADLSSVEWLRFKQVAERFEEAWQNGERPAVDAYLPAGEPERRLALPELVHVDLECRLKAGEPARVEDYWQRYPELADDCVGAAKLIAAEYDLRRRREPDLTWAEYVMRFPQYVPALFAARDTPRSGARGAVGEDGSRTPPGVSPPGREDGPLGPPPAGARLGKYELLEMVGSGSFGVVYRARDTELQRTVAVKVPRPGCLAGREEADRFLREARSAAQLMHPHIVALHEAHQGDGACYLVYEFVEGKTLAEQLRGGGLGFQQAAELLAQTAEALSYAHGHGVIHRDLKPSNIMLDAAGQPHVMDFGLARWETAESRLTVEGEVLGTPAYMSPEQARGGAHAVDGRSDVYSLGVILYEVLTEEVPFRGESRMVLRQVLEDEPRPPRLLNDRISRDLETICLKCLQKEPARRYAGAAALADDLRRFLAGAPIQARPVGPVGRWWAWARRRPAVAALLLTSGLALLASGAFVAGSFYYARLHQALRAEARARQKAEQFQYLHHISLAHAAWQANNVRRADRLLEDCPADQRGWEWHYLKRLRHGELLTLQGHTNWVMSVAFSPDGSRLASAGGDGTVRLWEAATGREIHVLRGQGNRVHGLAFSPDGARLASAGEDGTVRLWDVATGQEVLCLKGGATRFLSVGFSPGGTRLASAGMEGVIKLWDAATGLELLTFKGHAEPVRDVAFSPDGNRLASASVDGTVRVWEAATGRELLTPKRDADWIYGVAFSPDGKHLAFSSGKTVRIWQMATEQEARTLKGHNGDVNRLAFSPDGTLLASASDDGTVKVWDLRSGPDALRTLKGHTAGVWGVAFSPDGARLASASRDGTVKLWDTMAGQEARTLKPSANALQSGRPAPVPSEMLDARPPQARTFKGLWSGVFSPDATRIAAAGNDGTVTIWDAVTGQESRTFTGHTGAALSVAFSPDGTRVASAGIDGTVSVWESATGRGVYSLRGHGDRACCVAFSPDGTRLASAGVEGRWRPGSGRRSPPSDGTQLASAGPEETIRVWEAATGHELLTFRGDSGSYWLYDMAFSPDGKRLASSSDGRVWDLTTGRTAFSLQGHGNAIRSVAFSPDGTRLASASDDQTLKLWDAATGQEVQTFIGHLGNVLSLAFNRDGTRLASCGDDLTVRVWDTASGQETLILTGFADFIRRVTFSPNGTSLAAISTDGTVRVYDARPLTPEVVTERESLGLLEFLFARPLRKADVGAYLRRSPAIRPEVRDKALSLLERYRDEADPERYHQASWTLLRQPYLNPVQYWFALRQAETACHLVPTHNEYRTTLGAAQYRAGEYAAALATLEQADAARPRVPANLAFQAMAQHRLGRVEQAALTVAALRNVMKGFGPEEQQEARAFVREAEELLPRNRPRP